MIRAPARFARRRGDSGEDGGDAPNDAAVPCSRSRSDGECDGEGESGLLGEIRCEVIRSIVSARR
jgi:hypothetical protein